jgi:hypothetical protein
MHLLCLTQCHCVALLCTCRRRWWVRDHRCWMHCGRLTAYQGVQNQVPRPCQRHNPLRSRLLSARRCLRLRLRNSICRCRTRSPRAGLMQAHPSVRRRLVCLPTLAVFAKGILPFDSTQWGCMRRSEQAPVVTRSHNVCITAYGGLDQVVVVSAPAPVIDSRVKMSLRLTSATGTCVGVPAVCDAAHVVAIARAAFCVSPSCLVRVTCHVCSAGGV